jgi:hypothetical protein
MINEHLHKKAVGLDRVKHRDLRLDVAAKDLTTVRGMNAFFVAGTEFIDACKEYPVVWVKAGQDDAGKPLVAPIVVLGLTAGENLCVEGDDWRVRYVPAMMRLYPFAMARVAANELLVCIDESWSGLSTTQGEALFNADGTPTDFTVDVQKRLEQFELEVERTRLAGAVLVDMGLLRDMRFDATLGDGRKITVDGFLTIDEEKLGALPDADLVTLARNGLLGLIHAHQISLSNITRLVEWHTRRQQATAAAAAAAPVAAPVA